MLTVHAGALIPHTPPPPPPPPDLSVLLLMHMVGASATDFVDSSFYDRAMSAAGSAQLSSAAELITGRTVGAFPGGAGSYVTAANDPLFDFGTLDFTIELFVWIDPTNGVGWVFGNADLFAVPIAGGFYMTVSGAQPNFYLYNADGSLFSCLGLSLTTSAWHHIALVRDGNLLRLYGDGGFQGSVEITGSQSVQPSTSDIRVGGDSEGVFGGFKGYITELRVIRGEARYSGTTAGAGSCFAIPTVPFPDP